MRQQSEMEASEETTLTEKRAFTHQARSLALEKMTLMEGFDKAQKGLAERKQNEMNRYEQRLQSELDALDFSHSEKVITYTNNS